MVTVSAAGVGTRRGQQSGRASGALRRKQNVAAYVMVGPFVVVFLAMLVVPLVYSGYLSSFRTQLIGGNVFVGLSNYRSALTDHEFLIGLLHVALFLVIQVPVMIGLALLFALAIDSGRVRGSRFVRLAIFIPYAIPGVVATLLWGYLYGKDFGPINQILTDVGLPRVNFLGNGTIFPSIMNIVSWEFIGYNMIILYSALRAVPTELYDAAEVDGASQWRIARSVKIPAIRSALLLTVIFSVIGSFQLFNEPQLLYQLAPNVIGTNFTPNLYAYNLAFVSQNTNYAAAIAFLLGVVIAVISYVVQTSVQRGERGSRS